MMAQEKSTKNGKQKKWAHATINRHFAFLRHVFQLAVKDGKLARNPVSGIKFFPEANRNRFFSEDELTRIQKIMSPEDWKLVAFAIETGLRREEQFNLRWDQVCLETSTMSLPLPKGGKTRHVPLSEGAKTILRSLDSFLSSPWVFSNANNPEKPRSAQFFVNNSFTPSLRKAGISGACWHTLRHTAASQRVLAGVDLYAVKEILGHRDVETTLRYAHLRPDYLQEAVNRGSLAVTGLGTGSKTGSNEIDQEKTAEVDGSKSFDKMDEDRWLGDEESNLDRQIQNLSSCL